ncbi:MAG: glucokinase [Pseudomonadota bacterium]|nr:glucokinase [Pseudomonadota bacterium]
MNIIVADIGGTNSRLAWIERPATGKAVIRHQQSYVNALFSEFETLLAAFIAECGDISTISLMCLALPAPLRGESVTLTNIAWSLHRKHLAEQFNIKEVIFINDFQAAALGTTVVEPSKLITLNDSPVEPLGPRAVIGAGTGLGVAYMHWLQSNFRAFATEGGHVDFAPGDDIQEELYDYLEKKYDRVSYERILSGPGLIDLYNFCKESNGNGLSAGWVNQQAMQGDNLAAVTAMRLYATIYGSFVGNIVLMFRPSGGIYLVGGVTAKTAYWLQSEFFLDAFLNKGRMSSLAAQTPLFLVTDEDTGLKGIIEFALNQSLQENS